MLSVLLAALFAADTLQMPRMVEIPSGTFWMGTDNPPMEDWDEAPRREVKVDAFRMSATEITNAQYEAFDPTHKRGEQGPHRGGVGVRLPGGNDHGLQHGRHLPGKPVEGAEEHPRQRARFLASSSVRAQCVGSI